MSVLSPQTDTEFLNWVRDRLVYVHGESPNVAHVHALERLAQELAAKPEPVVEDPRIAILGELLRKMVDPLTATRHAGRELDEQMQGDPSTIATVRHGAGNVNRLLNRARLVVSGDPTDLSVARHQLHNDEAHRSVSRGDPIADCTDGLCPALTAAVGDKA